MSAAPAVHVYALPDSFNSALMPGRMGFERMYEVEHRIHHNLLPAAVPAEDAHLFFVPASKTLHPLADNLPVPEAT